MHFATTYCSQLEEFKMSKFFILMLFVLSLVSFNHAVASSHLDQTIIFNDAEKPDDGKEGEEKDPEDDCE
jgi:hypothetical protein